MRTESVPFDLKLDCCVVCRSPLSQFQSAFEGGFALRYEACRRCGLVQMNPRPSDSWIAHFYEHDYRAVSGDVDAQVSAATAGPKADNLKGIIGIPPARHLDLGCSTGVLLRTVGADVQVGIEPGSSHRETAAISGLEVHKSLDDLVSSDPPLFDLISLVHVLEHIADPIRLLETLRCLLTSHGRLLVEVPNLPQHRSYEPGHLLAFTHRTLVSSLGAAGFAVDSVYFHNVPQGGPGRRKNLVLIARAGPVTDQRGALGLGRVRMQRVVWVLPGRLLRWARRQRRRGSRILRSRLGIDHR